MQMNFQYGISKMSPLTFSIYGVSLIYSYDDLNGGYEFGKLGITLCDNEAYSRSRARVYSTWGGLIVFWKDHIKKSFEYLEYMDIKQPPPDYKISTKSGWVLLSDNCLPLFILPLLPPVLQAILRQLLYPEVGYYCRTWAIARRKDSRRCKDIPPLSSK